MRWLFVGVVGCTGETDDTTPTWNREVQPIVEARCAGCHTEGGVAPFALSTWEQMEPRAEAAVAAVEAGRMPPYPFDAECREVVGSRDLEEDELATLLAWRDAGFPKGPGEEPRTTTPEAPTLPPYDFEVVPEVGLKPEVGVLDSYRCTMPADTFASDRWVVGSAVDIDRADVVHHVLVYAIAPESVARVEELEALDAEPGFDCWGGTWTADLAATTLAGWAPGGTAWTPPESGPVAAMRVSAGSRVAIEVHYNTSVSTDEIEDFTGAGVWMLPEGEDPDLRLLSLGVVDYSLAIPAGAADVVEETITRLPIDGTLYGTAPHMHLLGKRLETTLLRADGSEQCISAVEPWDFDWQWTYGSAPIPITIEDQVRIRCTYDNTPQHQPVVDGVKQAPRDVGWGEGTTDEMCVDFLAITVPYQPTDETGTCAGFGDCFASCPAHDPFCPVTCLTHSGEACLYCGLEAMFGDCSTGACLETAIALGACYERCPDTDSDYVGCLYDACAEEYTAYEACWREQFVSGACTSDRETCTGFAP